MDQLWPVTYFCVAYELRMFYILKGCRRGGRKRRKRRRKRKRRRGREREKANSSSKECTCYKNTESLRCTPETNIIL